MVVPADTPVTKPVLLTVAILVAEDTHALVVAGVAVLANCVVALTQTLSVPVIVGLGLMLMFAFLVVVPQILVTLRLIFLDPGVVKLTEPGLSCEDVAGAPLGKVQAYVLVLSI